MSAQKGLVRGAAPVSSPPRDQSMALSPKRGTQRPHSPAKDGPLRRGLLPSVWSASTRAHGGHGLARAPPARPPALARTPLTGGQVPLVEVLQPGTALPLALLSWSLLHTGGHRVGPAWGHSGCAWTDPMGAPSPPSRPWAQGTPHPPLGPQQSQPRYQLKVTLHPVTFLERPGVQGVEGVQALPGVWGLLSKEHKQTLGKRGRTPSLHSLTLGEVTAEGWSHSIQDLRATPEPRAGVRVGRGAASGVWAPASHLQPARRLRGFWSLPQGAPPRLGHTLQRNSPGCPSATHPSCTQGPGGTAQLWGQEVQIVQGLKSNKTCRKNIRTHKLVNVWSWENIE